MFHEKFCECEGPYWRGLRMSQEKIKACCSAHHRKMQSEHQNERGNLGATQDLPAPSSATHEQAPMSSEPSDSVEQSQWDLGPVAAPKRRRVRTGPTVADRSMRAELN